MKGRQKNMSYAPRIASIVIPNKIKMDVVVGLLDPFYKFH